MLERVFEGVVSDLRQKHTLIEKTRRRFALQDALEDLRRAAEMHIGALLLRSLDGEGLAECEVVVGVVKHERDKKILIRLDEQAGCTCGRSGILYV